MFRNHSSDDDFLRLARGESEKGAIEVPRDRVDEARSRFHQRVREDSARMAGPRPRLRRLKFAAVVGGTCVCVLAGIREWNSFAAKPERAGEPVVEAAKSPAAARRVVDQAPVEVSAPVKPFSARASVERAVTPAANAEVAALWVLHQRRLCVL